MEDVRPGGAMPDTPEEMEECFPAPGVGSGPSPVGSTPTPYRHSSPCKTCTERKLYCHSTCEAYKTWTDAVKEMNKEDQKRNMCTQSYSSMRWVWKEWGRKKK